MSKQNRPLVEGEIVLKDQSIKCCDGVEITQIHLMPRQPERGRKISHPRVYPSIENYNPIEDIRSGERRNKPHNAIRGMLNEAFKRLGHDASSWDFKWSQQAGCSCGCSPGFIVKGYPTNVPLFDVWLTYKRS